MAINFPCLLKDLSDWTLQLSEQQQEERENNNDDCDHKEEYIEDIIIDSLKNFLLTPFRDEHKERSSEAVQGFNSVKNDWLLPKPKASQGSSDLLNNWLVRGAQKNSNDEDEGMKVIVSNDNSKWLLKNATNNVHCPDDIMEPVSKEEPRSFWLSGRKQDGNGSVPKELAANLSTTMWLASSTTDQLTCSTSSSIISSEFKFSSRRTLNGKRRRIEWPDNLNQLNWILTNAKAKRSRGNDLMDNWLVRSCPDAKSSGFVQPLPKSKMTHSFNDWLASSQACADHPNFDDYTDWLDSNEPSVKDLSLIENAFESDEQALRSLIKDAMEEEETIEINEDWPLSISDESSIVVLSDSEAQTCEYEFLRGEDFM